MKEKNKLYTNDIVSQNTFLPSIKDVFNVSMTFIFVSIAWVFFRIADISVVFSFFKTILFGLTSLSIPSYKSVIIYPIILLIIEWLNRKRHRNYIFGSPQIEFFFSFPLLIIMIIYHSTNQSQFIYFSF
jgi:hypothetical protein